MRVPFLDLRVTDPDLKAEMLRGIEAVLDHGRVLLGPEVAAFEEQLAGYCGVRHAIGVGSGTDALLLAALAAGLGPDDEVIMPCLSFVGTANGITMSGARPVFCDVTADLVMDPNRAEERISPRTRAIMPVHFTGRLADMAALEDLCRRRGLMLIEDAAPAIGADFQGRRAGSFGRLGCLSLNPMKVLNALGEAGAVLTDDDSLRDRLLALRYNGMVDKESCHFPSVNARLDTLQAAALLPRLARLEAAIARRRAVAARYDQALAGLARLPERRPGYRDVYYTYTIRTPRREALATALAGDGIETRIQHPRIIPQHPAYAEADLSPYSEALAAVAEVLCLPCHENMSDEQADWVAERTRTFFEGGGR